jgi:hypothetical protein
MICIRTLAAASFAVLTVLSPGYAMDRWTPAVRFIPQQADASAFESARGVQFFRHVACQLSSNQGTPRQWPVEAPDRLGSGSGNGMGIRSDTGSDQLVTMIMLAHPMDTMSSLNVLVCRASIMANGRDVTLYPADSSDVLVEQLGEIAKSGWPAVSPKLDTAKLAAVQSAGPSLRVYAEGMIALRPGDKVDFDTNAEQGTPPTEADLSFDGGSLTPLNGAQIAESFLVTSDCGQAKYSTKRLAYTSAAIPLGSYICIKTSQGRIAEFRIASAEGGTLSIGYTTYE